MTTNLENRIEENTAVTRTRETVSPQIMVNWNPEDDSGTVQFFLRDQVWENGVYAGLQKQTRLKNLGAGDSLTVDMQDIMSARIPLGGAEFDGIILMGLIKSYVNNVMWPLAVQRQQAAEDAALNPPVLPDVGVPEDSAGTTDPNQIELPI